MGSCSRARQGNSFARTVGRILEQGYRGAVGKTFVCKSVSLGYDEFNAVVRPYYTLVAPDGSQIEASVDDNLFCSDSTTVDDVMEMLRRNLASEGDPRLLRRAIAAIRAYIREEGEAGNPDALGLIAELGARLRALGARKCLSAPKGGGAECAIALA